MPSGGTPIDNTLTIVEPVVSSKDSDSAICLGAIRDFILKPNPNFVHRWNAISLFSGAGISDLGYQMAGFSFVAQVESDPFRAELGRSNYPFSNWIDGDVREARAQVIESYMKVTDKPLDLLVATPPCQGMSSSNPSRGKRKSPQAKTREEQNKLILEIIPIAQKLRPRLIVAENVRQILTLEIEHESKESRILDYIKESLKEYYVFDGTIDMADYGIPQTRKRAVIVAVRRDQSFLRILTKRGLLPWPKPTHAKIPVGGQSNWHTIREWIKLMDYPPLDAKSKEEARSDNVLHFVPNYHIDRYTLIKDIPAHSGRNAYENNVCPHCDFAPVPPKRVTCPTCKKLMLNRPIVKRGNRHRLIKGFHSSYRRMHSDEPAPTITTNSSHVGSDFKIHPWENRVLSILECADLQTVPRFFDWSIPVGKNKRYVIRNVVGEALPTYFTYLHGMLLGNFLSGLTVPESCLANIQG